jgi:hypothetical protein
MSEKEKDKAEIFRQYKGELQVSISSLEYKKLLKAYHDNFPTKLTTGDFQGLIKVVQITFPLKSKLIAVVSVESVSI